MGGEYGGKTDGPGSDLPSRPERFRASPSKTKGPSMPGMMSLARRTDSGFVDRPGPRTAASAWAACFQEFSSMFTSQAHRSRPWAEEPLREAVERSAMRSSPVRPVGRNRRRFGGRAAAARTGRSAIAGRSADDEDFAETSLMSCRVAFL